MFGRSPIASLAALSAVLLALGATASAQVQSSIGVAASDYPFLIQGKTVPGNGTLLEAEAVTSSYSPVLVDLADGARYILGIGSQARFAQDRIRLDGVSLEIASSGPQPQRIEVAGLALITTAPGSRGAVYTDQRDRVSVWVESGEITALGQLGKQLAKIGAGESLTISDTNSDLGPDVQDKRAPLEIARIQLRQLEHLAAVESESPPIRDKRRELTVALVEASGGLLRSGSFRSDAKVNMVIPTGMPAVNPEILLAATVRVGEELYRVRIGESGCGGPRCKSDDPPAARNTFDGWRGGLPAPFPSCTLCRVSSTEEP